MVIMISNNPIGINDSDSTVIRGLSVSLTRLKNYNINLKEKNIF